MERNCHGGAPGTGAPRGNTNARRHGCYSAQSREIRALGRVQNCVADLAMAQLAVMESLAQANDFSGENPKLEKHLGMLRMIPAQPLLSNRQEENRLLRAASRMN